MSVVVRSVVEFVVESRWKAFGMFVVEGEEEHFEFVNVVVDFRLRFAAELPPVELAPGSVGLKMVT